MGEYAKAPQTPRGGPHPLPHQDMTPVPVPRIIRIMESVYTKNHKGYQCLSPACPSSHKLG